MEKRRGLMGLVAFLAIVFNLAAVPFLVWSASRLSAMRKTMGFDESFDALLAAQIKASMLSAGFCVVKLACLAGVWMWKRWGLYGYLGTAVFSIVVSTRLASRAGLIGDAIVLTVLAVLMLPKHAQFD